MDKTRCFADNGDFCSALKVKKCKGCNFYTSKKDFEKDKKKYAYAKKYMQGEK